MNGENYMSELLSNINELDNVIFYIKSAIWEEELSIHDLKTIRKDLNSLLSTSLEEETLLVLDHIIDNA